MFILNQGSPTIEPKALFIPEFKKVWSRDTSKSKARANKDLAYVYFMADFQSEYNIYGIEKSSMVGLEIMKDKNFEPDELMLDAIKKYERIQETYSMRYLKSVRATVDSLMKFYNDLQYQSGQDDMKDYNPKKVTDALKDVESIIEKIEKWEKKVRGEDEEMQIRGGGKVGLFEDSHNATWLKQN